jgi:hypothetical protein
MGFKSIRKKRKPVRSAGPHSTHSLGPMAMPACPARWPKAEGVARMAQPKAEEEAQMAGRRGTARRGLRVVTAHGTPMVAWS